MMVDVEDSDSMVRWHRRGLVRHGLGVAVMLLAVLVTKTWSFETAVVLIGSMLLTTAAFGVLHALRLDRNRLSLFLAPVATIVTIGALDQVSHLATGLITGLITLSFLFVGLSQPPGSSFWLLPVAVPVFLLVLDLPTQTALVRLAVAAIVWIVVAEIPSNLITELREKQHQLQHLASTDPMTGLLNRTHLDAQLNRVGTRGAIALLDLDHFKRFNDEHGHLAGDRVLIDFATTLRSGSRAGDAVFRYGGEEFLVVMSDISPQDAAGVLERLRTDWAGHGSGLTFSVGIARSGASAVRDADSLLYRAKSLGRDRAEIAESDAVSG